MSEFKEPHSISKLIGAAPGYVGYENQTLLIDKIRTHPHSVVILDEIDILLDKDGDGILYTLTRTDNVSVLSISNYLDFKNLIKSRVTSSLNDKEIVFPPYGADQLSDILSERAQLSFNDDVLDSDVIPLCSAMAAKEEGDARYALDLLKNAGELAFDENAEKVTSEHVRIAKDRIEHNKVTEIIQTLPLQQQRVLEAILNLSGQIIFRFGHFMAPVLSVLQFLIV